MENQSLTPVENKTPEQIQYEMSQTREAITEKVSALENQVVGTVQGAADTFTDSVAAVRSLVTSAPGAVSDTVKQAAQAVSDTIKKSFDISGHVRENPWACLGISALAGCVTGWLVSGRRQALGYSSSVAPPPSTGAPTPTQIGSFAPTAPATRPGMFDELFAMLGRKVREVTENVIDSASAAVNKNVREGVPKLVDAATEMATDRLSAGTTAENRLTATFSG